jgi:hypothetical protein
MLPPVGRPPPTGIFVVGKVGGRRVAA